MIATNDTIPVKAHFSEWVKVSVQDVDVFKLTKE